MAALLKEAQLRMVTIHQLPFLVGPQLLHSAEVLRQDQVAPALGTVVVEAEVELALVTMGLEPLVKVLMAAAVDTTLVVAVEELVSPAHGAITDRLSVTAVMEQSAQLFRHQQRLPIL